MDWGGREGIATYSLRHFTGKHFLVVIEPITFFRIAAHNHNVTFCFPTRLKLLHDLHSFFPTKAFQSQILRSEQKSGCAVIRGV